MRKLFKDTNSPILEWIIALILAAVISIAIRKLYFEPFSIVGWSMAPTLKYDDHVAGFKNNISADTIKKGEIIVFVAPNHERRTLIKRVIATGGDTVEIIKGSVFVNGQKLDEPYILQEEAFLYANYPKTRVPYNTVFALGDNRNNSYDSRLPSIGMVPIKDIEAKVTFCYWPPYRIGSL